MGLSASGRRGILEYVRPLYAGLDGASSFGQVARVERRIAAIRGELEADAELLELLTLFHGVVERLGSLARGGRADLLLAGAGVETERRALLLAGLDRFRTAPESVEERLLHDAVLLESTGITALVARLLTAGRRRVPLERAVAALDPGPAPERCRTPGGAAVAAERRSAAAAWLESLRAALEAERRETEGSSRDH